MKFELVDQVVEQSEDRIQTVKNVSAAEEYLQDHFPSFPILPGVMMLECLVQAARKLLETSDGDGDHAKWVLGEVKNVRYGNMVQPGQQLRVDVSRFKENDGMVTFKGEGKVCDNVAVQGRFVMRRLINQV